MDRRNAVKNLAIASTAIISLPFWMTACRLSDKDTHLSSFSLSEQELLAAIVDALIPEGPKHTLSSTESTLPPSPDPGAITLGLDKFLQKMLDDCYEKSVQENAKKQLASLDDLARASYGEHFERCALRDKHAMITKGLESADKDVKDFFTLVKNETIRGFNTSQRVMQDYQGYKVAPGHYWGCVEIKN